MMRVLLLMAMASMLACGRSHEDTVDGMVPPDLGRDLGPRPDFGPPPEPCPEPIDLDGAAGPEGAYPENAFVTVAPTDGGGWRTGLVGLELRFAATDDGCCETTFASADFHFPGEGEPPIGRWTDEATDSGYDATIELAEPATGTSLEAMGMLRARVQVPDLAIDLAVEAPWCELWVQL